MADWSEDTNLRSPVTAPGAVTTDKRTPPCVGHAAYSDRYPEPSRAELVTLWHKNKQTVLAITADGKTQDFYMPPGRLVTLLREIAERLADNTILQ